MVIGKDPPRLIHEFLLARNNDPKIKQRIAHIHGIYRNPESTVLSSKDYQEAYGLVAYGNIFKLKDYQEISSFELSSENQVQKSSEWTFHRKLLWAVLATRRVVFVGFSMNDPYLNKMLETVSEDLWGWDKSTHFAIMSISYESAVDSKTKSEKLKSDYGVSTVFYEILGNSHQGLDNIIDEIAKECNIDIQRTKIWEWLEQANERME